MNETTKQPYEGRISPRPWHAELREYIAANKRGWIVKKTRWILVDANGRDVWHTFANVRLICDAVNGNC